MKDGTFCPTKHVLCHQAMDESIHLFFFIEDSNYDVLLNYKDLKKEEEQEP